MVILPVTTLHFIKISLRFIKISLPWLTFTVIKKPGVLFVLNKMWCIFKLIQFVAFIVLIKLKPIKRRHFGKIKSF